MLDNLIKGSQQFNEESPPEQSSIDKFKDAWQGGVAPSIYRMAKRSAIKATYQDDPEFVWDAATRNELTSYTPEGSDAPVKLDRALHANIFEARSRQEAEALREMAIERQERMNNQDKLSTGASIGYGLLGGIFDPANVVFGLGAVKATTAIAKRVPSALSSPVNRIGTSASIGAVEGAVASSIVYADDELMSGKDILINATAGAILGGGMQGIGEAITARRNSTTIEAPNKPSEETTPSSETISTIDDLDDSETSAGAQQVSNKFITLDTTDTELEDVLADKVDEVIQSGEELFESNESGKLHKGTMDFLSIFDLTRQGVVNKVNRASEKVGERNVANEFLMTFVLNDNIGTSKQANVTAEAVKANVENLLLGQSKQLIDDLNSLRSSSPELNRRLYEHLNRLSVGKEPIEQDKTILAFTKRINKLTDNLYDLRAEAGVIGFDKANKITSGYMPRMANQDVMNYLAKNPDKEAIYASLMSKSIKDVMQESTVGIKLRIEELSAIEEPTKAMIKELNSLKGLYKKNRILLGELEPTTNTKPMDFSTAGRVIVQRMNEAYSNPAGVNFKRTASDYDLLEELLKLDDNFSDLSDVLADSIKLIKQSAVKSNRARMRMNMDFDNAKVEVDGEVFRLSDLFNDDMASLLDQQVREVAGEVGLASVGIKGLKDYEDIIKLAHSRYLQSGVSDEKASKYYRDMMDVYDLFLNRATHRVTGATAGVNNAVRRVKEYGMLTTLENAGISQISDFASTIAVGLRGSLSKKFVSELDEEVNKTLLQVIKEDRPMLVGADHKLTRPTQERVFESNSVLPNSLTVEGISRSQKTIQKYDKLSGKLVDALFHVNGQNLITKLQQMSVVNAYGSQLFDDVGRLIVKGTKLPKRYRNAGVDQTFVDGIKKAYEEGHIKFNEQGVLITANFSALDNGTKEHLYTIIRTGTNNRVLRSGVSASIPLFESPVGRLLGFLMNFATMAYSKILLRHVQHLDAESARYLFAALIVGIAVSEIKTGLRNIQTDDSDDTDYLTESMLLEDPVRSAMLIAGTSGATAYPMFLYELAYNSIVVREIADELGGVYTPSNAYFGMERGESSKFGVSAIEQIPAVSVATGLARNTRSVVSDLVKGETDTDTLDKALKVAPLGDHAVIKLLEELGD